MSSLDKTVSITKSPECITPSAFDTKSRKQSAKVGIFNLISTMIGGGALSLPFAISRCGLILGFSLLFLSAMLSIFSFDILIATSRRTGAMTYQQIGYFAFGSKLALFVTVIIWFNCYIASIAYCVLIGDLIKPVVMYIFNISNSTETLRRIVIASAILCVSPFCYMRQIGGLKYTSIVSILSIVVLTTIITVKTLQHFGEEHTMYYINDDGDSTSFVVSNTIDLWPKKWEDVVYVFPVFGISFLCHFNIPQVHSELTRPTRKRMRKVLTAVTISCCFLYSTISFFGYFYSFRYTCGNILLNYRQDDPVVTFGRLCLGFVILFTFPLLILPARTSLHNILNAFRCSCDSINYQQHAPDIKNEVTMNDDNKEDDDTFTTNEASKTAAEEAEQHIAAISSRSEPDLTDVNTPSVFLRHQLKATMNAKEVQKVNTGAAAPQRKTTDNSDLGYSLDGAAVNYSLISDIDELKEQERQKQQKQERKSKMNFTSRSFSNADSPLRGPTDALGIVNEPSDLLLLQDEDFVKRFKGLERSINYQPNTCCLIVETTFMIGSSLLVSFLTESVMVLWGLLGSTVGFMIAFTLPGFFYFKIRYHKGLKRRNVLSLLIAVLSCFCIVLCTWQAMKRLSAESCPVQP